MAGIAAGLYKPTSGLLFANRHSTAHHTAAGYPRLRTLFASSKSPVAVPKTPQKDIFRWPFYKVEVGCPRQVVVTVAREVTANEFAHLDRARRPRNPLPLSVWTESSRFASTVFLNKVPPDRKILISSNRRHAATGHETFVTFSPEIANVFHFG